jgi:2-polyprenyl-3-methyl-5-hydroxy-6-metoxy-1,4-benzoquinol methylase
MTDLRDLPELRRGAEWAIAAGVALELGLIDELAERPAGPGTLASRLGLEARGVEALLGALDALGAVEQQDGIWRLTGQARARFVDRDTPDFEADSLRHWMRSIRRWATELESAVRTGGPPPGRQTPADGAKTGRELENFMAAMANRAPSRTAAVADAVRRAAPAALSLLDVGGGPGVLARALAERGFQVTLLDRTEVIELAAERYGLSQASGIRLLAGDVFELVPDPAFDVVLLSNLSHIYGPERNRDLLARASGVLAPGGSLAIVDFVRGVSEFAPLFALTMLLSTYEGGTWTLKQYESWLRGAGLEHVRCRTILPEVQLLTAVRPAGSHAP